MEALERRGKQLAIGAILLIVFWSQCKGVDGHRNTTKMWYVCPPDFIRLGHSCYYFSDTKATWQNALFSCKDKDSNLSVPARWEDRHLRKYLNNPDIVKASRWIGGIYDKSAQAWKWGGELQQMRYQSFSKMKKMTPKELEWHCIAMMPELLYRWAPRSCFEPRQYICQAKLLKASKSKVTELRRRYQRMGKTNEIKAPNSRETDDPRINDVTNNPVLNPKSYDLRPSPLRLSKDYRNRSKPYKVRPNDVRKRSRPNAQRRLKRPFPGYQWNRRNPEGSYQYNADLLKSGRTGLSPQQVKGHLSRLRHLRDKQLARRRMMKNRDDWLVNDQGSMANLVQTHARTYTVDNNISALHPKNIVEEFDMLLPPSLPVVLPRPARGAG